MGWVLDWEHVTPPVEPYWSPEKAYFVVPLKEIPPKVSPEKATGDREGAHMAGGNKGGAEIDWDVVYDAIREAKEPTPLEGGQDSGVLEVQSSGGGETLVGSGEGEKGLAVSNSHSGQKTGEEDGSKDSKNEGNSTGKVFRFGENGGKSAEVNSGEYGDRNGKAFKFGKGEARSAGADSTEPQNHTGSEEAPASGEAKPSVPVEWIAPGKLMTADGLVDVSELRPLETMVTAIHTGKEYRVFRVLEDTCLDSPFIYRHKEERREWGTFTEYYRTK